MYFVPSFADNKLAVKQKFNLETAELKNEALLPGLYHGGWRQGKQTNKQTPKQAY